MEQVKASEVVAELRRMSRTYELFKRAEDMVQVLVDFEARKRQLEKDIELALKKREDLDKAYEKACLKYDDSEAAAGKRLISVEQQIVHNQKLADEILTKARQEVASMVADAKSEVNQIRECISENKRLEEKTRQEAEEAKEALARLVAEFNAKKAQLLKAFD